MASGSILGGVGSSNKRETPHGKRVASGSIQGVGSSNKRETPRGKRVASESLLVFDSSSDREVPRDKPVASFSTFEARLKQWVQPSQVYSC